ncbi:MAG: hypothetical protein N7Q72_06625, partial [Spiroplasma sp. Tabriz.8]|nr:hypothetical protein [Spiroplasma sp. Tabriz.8]
MELIANEKYMCGCVRIKILFQYIYIYIYMQMYSFFFLRITKISILKTLNLKNNTFHIHQQ